MTTLQALRAQFPALDGGLCFLDWAATGLLPEVTRAAIHAYVDELATCPTRQSVWPHARHAETRNRARVRVAGLLHARAEDIALVENTTQGLQIAAESLPLMPGENVIVHDLDYLAVALPWLMRRRVGKIEVRQVPCRDGAVSVPDIVAAIDDRTRLIAVSTIGWTTGALLDLPSLAAEARARGLFLVVDAMQTFGVIPLDVRANEVSCVAVGGHKWLNSTLGSGFLYVQPNVAARARPGRFGFLAGQPGRHENWWTWFTSGDASLDDDVVFPASGRTFETGGTPSYVGALGLSAMCDLLASVGIDSIAEHVRALGGRLIEGLERLGLEVLTPRATTARGGIVVFRVDRDVRRELALVDRLKSHDICVSARYMKNVGGVRVSIHGMNVAGEIDRVLAALETELRA